MYTRRLSILIAAGLVAGVTTAALADPVIVSRATDGAAGNGPSVSPSLSGTGRFVAFVSFASNLVAGDTNGFEEVFLRDRDTDADGVFDEAGAVSTVRVSQLPGVQGNGPSHNPVITPDGRYVVFITFASSFFAVGQGTLPFPEVMRWDRQTGELILVSRNTAGHPLDGACTDPVVTADGNAVYFRTMATNVDGDSAGSGGLIVRRDIAAGQIARVSPATAGASVSAPAISDDGRVVAYATGPSPGSTITVLESGVPVATYPGVEPKLSRDGRFLAAIDIQALGPAFRVHLATGARRTVRQFGNAAHRLFYSSTGRYLVVDSLFVDFTYQSMIQARSGDVIAYDATDTAIAYALPEFPPSGITYNIAVLSMAETVDSDGNGLNNHWEAQFLRGDLPVGGNAPGADPDNDGLTNAQEYARGSHPFSTSAAYLAEGTSSPDFFTTRYAIVNPNASPVSTAVRLERGGAVPPVILGLSVPGRGRVTLDSHELGLDTSSFSAVIEGSETLIVDRLMTWGPPGAVPYGSHAETASGGPAMQWFLAEGTTVLGFQLFYLLQNPQATATTATVRFLLPSGAPLVRTYDLPAQSRTTIYVNTVPGLEATDLSADISATQPIAVERAMYRSAAGQVFALGHAAAAVGAPATTWYFAEGATGSFFDTYLLLANPSSQAAQVQVQYLRDIGGAVTQTYTVAANSRFSIYVDGVTGLESANFGARVTSDVPVVAERAMYWAGGFFDYYEGHVSAGATATGSLWYLAECEVGGPRNAETYVLIANTSAQPVSLGVHLLGEVRQPTGYDQFLTLPGNTRISLPMSAFPGPVPPSGRFGVEVLESGSATGGLVVEGAMYWSAPGQLFAAGANWPGTRIR